MTQTGERPTWVWVALLFVTATAGYLCRTNLSIAAALMMPEFGISQAQMGTVFSAFLLGYAIFQMPGGILADRVGARRVLATLPWLWVLFTLAVASLGTLGPLWGGLTLLLLLRFIMGAVAAPTYPASAQAVSRWVPPQSRASANGWVIGSVGFGSALAPLLITSVMTQWGWRVSLVASAIPAAVMALVWMRVRPPATRPDAASVRSSAPEPGIPSAFDERPHHLASWRFALLTISYSLQGYVGYIFVFWFYLYLVQERHFSIAGGAVFSSLPWVLSMIAIPAGGAIADRLSKGRLGPVWGRRLVPIVGMIGSGVCLSVGAHTANAYIAAVALAASTALILCVEGPFWATMNDLAGARSGLGGGIMNTGCNIGGLISPALTPALAATMGWEPALHLAAGLAIAAGLLWFWTGPLPTSSQRPDRSS
jgi:ACS family glucarate transporter-like MFS transporter